MGLHRVHRVLQVRRSLQGHCGFLKGKGSLSQGESGLKKPVGIGIYRRGRKTQKNIRKYWWNTCHKGDRHPQKAGLHLRGMGDLTSTHLYIRKGSYLYTELRFQWIYLTLSYPCWLAVSIQKFCAHHLPPKHPVCITSGSVVNVC